MRNGAIYFTLKGEFKLCGLAGNEFKDLNGFQLNIYLAPWLA